MLANFAEHTRTLRCKHKLLEFFNFLSNFSFVSLAVYPRPVVAFQINSFLRSRPRASLFLNRFSRTQAVEFLAEWSLTPTNLAFLRVQTGMLDPTQVGDKGKWFAHQLTPIRFSVWDDGSSLNGALRSLKQHENQATDESGSDSEGAESTSSSYSSLSDFVSEMVSSDLSPSLQEIYSGTSYHHHVINQSISLVDPKLVYRPPSKLQYPEGYQDPLRIEEDNERADSVASTSSSRSDLSSPSFNRDSEFEFNPKTKSETQTTRTDKEEIGSFESENSNSTTTTKTAIYKEKDLKKKVSGMLLKNPFLLNHNLRFRSHHQSAPLRSIKRGLREHRVPVPPAQATLRWDRPTPNDKVRNRRFSNTSPAMPRNSLRKRRGKAARTGCWRM